MITPRRPLTVHTEGAQREICASFAAQVESLLLLGQQRSTFLVIAFAGQDLLSGLCVPARLDAAAQKSLLDQLRHAGLAAQNFGVASFPEHGANADALIRSAAAAADVAARNNALLVHCDDMLAAAAADIVAPPAADSARNVLPATGTGVEFLLQQIIENDPVATFVLNADRVVTHWNKACAQLTGFAAARMLNTRQHWAPFYPAARPVLADLVISGEAALIDKVYAGAARKSTLIEGAYEAEGFFPAFHGGGRWLYFTATPLFDAHGGVVGAIETLQDTTQRRVAEERLRKHQNELESMVRERTSALAAANAQLAADAEKMRNTEEELLRRYTELTELAITLSDTKEQLLQSEKLASIGQLAAGVAHEINTPIGYVNSNLGALNGYVRNLLSLIDAMDAVMAGPLGEDVQKKMAALKKELDIDYLKEDMPGLISESMEGVRRVRKIVQDLKDFSRVDTSHEMHVADLHQGIDAVLSIVASQTRGRAEIIRVYGELPQIECVQTQLNQVFMNIIVNAAQAMPADHPGKIVIRTGATGDKVWLEFADNGCGMAADVLPRIFDPFFTTKPVGVGTGLGLSLAYSIIQEHHGSIDVRSEMGKGSVFMITLPCHQPPSPADKEK